MPVGIDVDEDSHAVQRSFARVVHTVAVGVDECRAVDGVAAEGDVEARRGRAAAAVPGVPVPSWTVTVMRAVPWNDFTDWTYNWLPLKSP